MTLRPLMRLMRALRQALCSAVFICLALAGIRLPAYAEVPEVRFWVPYDDASQVFFCLKTDLNQWSSDISAQLGEVIFPHRIINLPEGRYVDQIRAAIDTGEQPHFLLLEGTQKNAVPPLAQAQGEVFGTDLMGVWVDEAALAFLPRALTSLNGIWSGEAESALLALDDVLVLISGQGALTLGIDTGPQGADVGLSMALLVRQWTEVFATPEAPNWRDPAFGVVLETLTRWQQEELMQEVNLATLRSSAGLMPFLTLARYSAGKDLGPDFAFYPLFSIRSGQRAAFLGLPYDWYLLRPEEEAITDDVWTAIREKGADQLKVFDTCAETAGLLSRRQLLGETPVQADTDAQGGAETGTETGAEAGTAQTDGDAGANAASSKPQRELAGFMARESPNFPTDLGIEVWDLTAIGVNVPGQLADTLRDMRAGLSLQNALEALETYPFP